MTSVENRTPHKILLIIHDRKEKETTKQINLKPLEHTNINFKNIDEVVIG